MLRHPRVIALAIAVSTSIAGASAANAQGFFDLFGGDGYTGAPSGRDVVSFNQSYAPGQIIVSFGDRRLYHIRQRGVAVSYPIAVPRPQSRWAGTLTVSTKRVNPDWTPTAQMRRENPALPSVVPGGHPRNPLGPRALYLGSSLYRIHGTDAPWTIGQNVSKGCVRMHNEHAIELYNNTPVGTKVTATWNRFQTTATASLDVPSSGGSAPSVTAANSGDGWIKDLGFSRTY